MNEPTGTEARVCADIAARQQLGVKKYGTTVADNPLTKLEWLRHAYEETLDLAVYLRRLIDEEEARGIEVRERCRICGQVGHLAPLGCEWCGGKGYTIEPLQQSPSVSESETTVRVSRDHWRLRAPGKVEGGE